MLSDAAGLAGRNIGLSYSIEKACLAVVDMSHDNNDRRSGPQVLFFVVRLVDENFFFANYYLFFYEAAELIGHEFCRIEVYHV